METLDGWFLRDGRLVRGHATVAGDGVEFWDGPCEEKADAFGIITRPLVDWHTHCADAGVHPRPGMTLEELVAPPDGLKHRYLRTAPRERIAADMRGFEATAASNGIGAFVDFREGGADGCRLLREACGSAFVLGRPTSPEFDPSEMDDILSVADGIAVSSVLDMDRRYAERVADAAHRAGKPFAVHVSERVREDIDGIMALEPAFVVHMVEATDSDLRRCADEGVPVVSCPRSNAWFGKVPPLARMLDAGCDVALGTDNAMLCAPDMRLEAAAAADVLEAQGRPRSDVWNILIAGASKLLNDTKGLGGTCKGARAVVLPCPGNDPMGALAGTEPVHVPRK